MERCLLKEIDCKKLCPYLRIARFLSERCNLFSFDHHKPWSLWKGPISAMSIFSETVETKKSRAPEIGPTPGRLGCSQGTSAKTATLRTPNALASRTALFRYRLIIARQPASVYISVRYSLDLTVWTFVSTKICNCLWKEVGILIP